MKTTDKKITEVATIIKKGANGWEAKNIRTEKNRTFEIITYKSRKSLISIAREVKIYVDGSFIKTTFLGSLLDAPFLEMKHDVSKVTEKNIVEKHSLFLSKFDEKVNSIDFTSVFNLTIGDIIFLDGYGKAKGSKNNHHIIYKIVQDTYFTIEKDSLIFEQHTHVKDIQKKFGIGMYYSENFNISTFNISENDLQNMIIEGKKLESERILMKELEQLQQEERRKAKEEFLSQYTQADKRKTTILIKKYILERFKEVRKVEIASETYSGGSNLDVTYYSTKEIEEIDIFINSLKEGNFNSMEDIYEYSHKDEVIIENHILMTYKYVGIDFVKVEEKEKEIKSIEINSNGLFMVKYSEKAGAIYGNTKPHKEILKGFNCRFNPRLNINEETTVGWIFKISQFQEIKEHFNL